MTEREIDRKFGEFIAARRLALNWGWYKASSKTGISHLRIQSLERGSSHRSVTPAECRALAEGYGVSAQTLLRIAAGELEVA